MTSLRMHQSAARGTRLRRVRDSRAGDRQAGPTGRLSDRRRPWSSPPGPDQVSEWATPSSLWASRSRCGPDVVVDLVTAALDHHNYDLGDLDDDRLADGDQHTNAVMVTEPDHLDLIDPHEKSLLNLDGDDGEVVDFVFVGL